MKDFNIYENKGGKIKVVKKGWSWLAAFFNIFWALYNKMWLVAFGTLAITISIGIIGIQFPENISNILSFLVNIIVFVWFGFFGYKWKEKNIIFIGFEFRETISAKNEKDALTTYLGGKSLSQVETTNLLEKQVAKGKSMEENNLNSSSHSTEEIVETMPISTNTRVESTLNIENVKMADNIGKYLQELIQVIPFVKKLGYDIDEIEVDVKLKNKILVFVTKIDEVKLPIQEKIVTSCQEQNISIIFLSTLVELSKIQNEVDIKKLFYPKIEIDLKQIPSIKIKFTNKKRTQYV